MRTLICALTFFLSTVAFAEHPEIFSDLSFDDALTQSVEQEKLLVVDFTATWCGPCKMMDRNTWSNEEVIAWLNEHAITLQIDVDVEEAFSQQMKITAMPTVIAFRNGEAFDRSVGYMDPDQLLDWLGEVQEGRTKIDKLREAAGDRMDENGNVDIDARYELASQFLQAASYEEATEEYVWLWQHMLEYAPAMLGVRSSFMASDMTRLAQAHEPALMQFTALRDETHAKLESSPNWDDLSDWIVLNKVISDDEATLAWFDRIKQDPEKLAAASRLAYQFEDLLIEHDRWADLGMLYQDPVAKLKSSAWLLSNSLDYIEDEQMREEAIERQKQMYRNEAARLYATMLTVGREQVAEDVVAHALSQVDDDAMRVTLVATSLAIGQPRKRQQQWLDQLQTPRPELQAELESALQAVEE